MSYYDVYIGNLEDPEFHWEGGNWNGNVPERLSLFFPPEGSAGQKNPFWVLLNKIDAKIFEGKQTDWGGWVARVKKDQIVAFIDEVYGDYGQPSSLPHLCLQCEELRSFVATLDPEKQYALVASEL